MTYQYVPTTVEVYLCNQEGVRFECLDYCTSYAYSVITNDVSPFVIRLPRKLDLHLLAIDQIIEIRRGHGPGTSRFDYVGFVRGMRVGDDNGLPYTELSGLSLMELLNRRIVNNTEGSTQASMTDEADDMLKAIVTDQLGGDAGAGRDLTSVGGGFTVQANLSLAPSITKDFAYQNLLKVCKDIANASAQAGTKLFFDIIPIVPSVTTGKLAFEFRTTITQRGADRTWDSGQPLMIGDQWGNFQNGSWILEAEDEVNWAQVGGMGKGTSRELTAVSDTTRMNTSIWNRREGFADARNASSGDAAARTAARTSAGNTYLRENKPRLRLLGDIVETPYFRYGRDWFCGDMVTISYAGRQADAMIDKILVSRGEDGQETIEAHIEIEA